MGFLVVLLYINGFFFLIIFVWSKNLLVYIVIKSEVSWFKRISFWVNKFIIKNKNIVEKKRGRRNVSGLV